MKFARSFIASLLFVSLAAVSVAADNQHIIRRNTRDKSGVESALDDENIVGGVNVSGQEFPFFVQGAIAFFENCAASLILPDVILTAASCVESFLMSPRVLVGSYRWNDTSSNDTQWRSVISGTQRIHPKYNDAYPYLYDTAVIKIEAVSLPNLKPINLNMDKSEPVENEKLLMMGYGDTLRHLPNVDGKFSYPTVLQKVDLKLVDFPRCVSMYQNENETADWFTVNDTSLMCASETDKGSCYGDSGGPLIRELSPTVYELVGVTLHSYGCAMNGFPVIFSNVADLYDWITTTAKEISAFSFPTPSPTKAPISSPTNRPTNAPTRSPTSRPTTSPTERLCYPKGEKCNLTPKRPCCPATPKLICLGTTKKCGLCVKKGKKCKVKGDCCKKVCVKGVCTK